MSTFAAPAASSGFTPADHDGHLLVIEVHSYQTGIVTSLGEKDAISATIHDVDLGETFDDALIFPRVLVGSLKSRVGQKVLARLGQGVAKPGQSAPWILNDASGDGGAVTQAEAYLARVAQAGYAPVADAPAPVAAPVAVGDTEAIAAAKALLAQQGLTQ